MQGGAVLKSAHLGWKVKFYLHCQKDLATPKEEMTLGLRIRSFFSYQISSKEINLCIQKMKWK